MPDDNLGTVGVVGTKGNQVAVATTAVPVQADGNAVPLSTDLVGALRII